MVLIMVSAGKIIKSSTPSQIVGVSIHTMTHARCLRAKQHPPLRKRNEFKLLWVLELGSPLFNSEQLNTLQFHSLFFCCLSNLTWLHFKTISMT